MSPSSPSTHAPSDAGAAKTSDNTVASCAVPMQRTSRTSLERKLELLEARFTAPMGSIASPTEQATQLGLFSPSSTATTSQHSFAFDAPSLSNTSMANNHHGRPKQDDWKTVTEQHLQNVQAETTNGTTVNVDKDASSNQTIVTSHKTVVHESPPLAVALESSSSSFSNQNSNHSKPTNNNNKKRKSVPVKCELPSVKENIKTNQVEPKGRNNKRTRLPDGSPLKASAAEESNSRSNPAKSVTSRSAKATTAPTNNKSIYDFFPRTSTTTTTATTSTRNKSQQQSPNNRIRPQNSRLQTTTTSPSPENSAASIDRLRQRCLELERTVQDKDEQLRAVSNNRTILHSALQSALEARQEELNSCKERQAQLELDTSRVIEALCRSDASRQAKELRERLALDGARLGRIVYSRAGMRSVETWEDGHACKALQTKRADLKSKRQALEQRQGAAKKAAKQVLATAATAPAASEGQLEDDDAVLVGGIPVRSPLDAMEAVESIRLHLANVRRLEKELTVEEQALNDEKCAHIRALKRVASEDASRFRSRPKLHDRYVLKALLGKGGFSEVWQAYDLAELREVAVKIHQLDPRWPDTKKENYTKHVSREYEIHRNVRHPRIVSLFDVFEIDNNSFATVLELCNGTDLDTLLKEKKRLVERDARAILLQILLGMQYLSHPATDGSRQGIIHYDLKPGNILFDEFGDAKITDFGLSKIVDTPDPAESMELTSQGAGTYWYLPPECFVDTKSVRISNKVDVWSIGVIFYQMLYGRRPFGDGQSQDKILSDRTMLNAHQVTFPEKPTVSEEGKQFIRACLTYDQAFRPTIAQICQNPYVLSKQF